MSKNHIIIGLLLVIAFLGGSLLTVLLTHPRATAPDTDRPKAQPATPPAFQTPQPQGVQTTLQPSPAQLQAQADLVALDRLVNEYNTSLRRIESSSAALTRAVNGLVQTSGDPQEARMMDQATQAYVDAVSTAKSLLERIRSSPSFSQNYRFGALIADGNDRPAAQQATGGQGFSYLEKL